MILTTPKLPSLMWDAQTLQDSNLAPEQFLIVDFNEALLDKSADCLCLPKDIATALLKSGLNAASFSLFLEWVKKMSLM